MPEQPLNDLGPAVAFCDPSGGKGAVKRVSARSALVVVAQDALQRVFVLSAWAARCPTERLIDQLFETGEKYQPRRFGVEANAMQSLFADTLVLESKRRASPVKFEPVYQPTRVDKTWRIRSVLQPLIGAGRLFLHPGQHELRSELLGFPMGQVVDLVDALASAVALLPLRAPQQAAADESNARLAYLRASGAPPAYIESVAHELTSGLR